MEVIWVIENVLKTQKFYNRRRLSLLIASISLWKKYHPNHFTVLYCDKKTHEVLNNLNVLHLWDEIRDLDYPDKIDRKIFWSTCKTKVISETKTPLLVVDHDFFIFKNIDDILKNNILTYTYDELTLEWYPNKRDKFNTQLSSPINKSELAANVSLFYLPDPNFANEYGKQVLQNHKEFTKMGVDCTNYMIYSEQYMLKEWLDSKNIPHQTLNNQIFDNKNTKYTDQNNKKGIWSNKEALLSYKHYGVLEEQIDQTELDYIFRCINTNKKVNIKELKNKLYESYPC
tara:strand:+ start:1078 stop:1935 length:858 start_codon:yes stop_codon:yes gene_type:complete